MAGCSVFTGTSGQLMAAADEATPSVCSLVKYLLWGLYPCDYLGHPKLACQCHSCLIPQKEDHKRIICLLGHLSGTRAQPL